MEYSAMSVAALRDELRDRSLSTTGRKTDLIWRLEESDAESLRPISTDDDFFLETNDVVPKNGAFSGNKMYEEPKLDNPEELARAAREAVETSVSSSNSARSNTNIKKPLQFRDWTKVSLAELRKEASSRGLPVAEKKIELIATLEESDFDDLRVSFIEEDSDRDMMDDLIMDDAAIDIVALGKAAREAVLLFESDDEPSDEALWEIENATDDDDDGLLVSSSAYSAVEGFVTPRAPLPNYEAMAVSQLKAELKNRGLRVTGKKVDLIQRLQESDK
jgi:SAP domain